MTKRTEKLFIYIATQAMERGWEVRLESKDYRIESNIVKGAIQESESRDNGVVLSIYQPTKGDE